jgi:hypothetical protein
MVAWSREGFPMNASLIDYLVDKELNPGNATTRLSKKHRKILESRNPSRIQAAMFAEKPFEAPLCRPNRLFNTIQ